MKRFLKFIVAPLLLAFVSIFALDATLVLKFTPKYLPPNTRADAVVILGAAPNSAAIFYRTLTGLRIFESGKAPVMVVSGGRISEKDETEADNMYKIISRNATITPKVIKEGQANNTYQNLYYSRTLIPDAKSIVVVSDKYHLPRAVTVARFAGFENVYWASPDESYYSPAQLRLHYFREMVAMLYYIPRLIF